MLDVQACTRMVPDRPSSRARLYRFGDFLLLALLFIAVGTFVAVGAGRSIWQDEAATILISDRSFTGIIEGLRHENNFPVYFFLLSIWIRLVGDSEIALRALSAIFYVSGGVVAFALGRRVCSNRRGAWYSAFFYLCSPLAVVQAQNIRMYALLGLLAGLSVLIFVRLFFDQVRSWGVKTLYLFINAVGILTHLWFVFLLAAQLAAILVFERRQLRAWVASAGLAAAPFLAFWGPRLLDQAHNGATDWMAMYPSRLLLLAPFEFYGFLALPFYGAAACAWILARPDGRDELHRARMIPLMLLLFVAGLGCPLLVSVVKPIYFPGRYAVIALPPLAALLAALLSNLLPRLVLPFLCFPLLALGVVNQIAHREDVPDAALPAGQSDRTTAQYLLGHAETGDAIVFTGLTRPAAEYYFRRSHAERRFVEISFPEENAGHPGWAPFSIAADQRAALEAEAAATTRRLQQIAASGGKIWLYYGAAPLVSEVLKRKMDSALPPPRELRLMGPYHNSVLEYAGTRP